MTNEIRLQSADTETFKEKFLTTTGRINRLTFFKRSIALFVINFLTIFFTIFLIMLGTTSTNPPSWMTFILIAIMGVLLIPQYCLNVKRLHDFGKDATIAKIFLVINFLTIIYNFNISVDSEFIILDSAAFIIPWAFSLYLLFKKGDEGANEYDN